MWRAGQRLWGVGVACSGRHAGAAGCTAADVGPSLCCAAGTPVGDDGLFTAWLTSRGSRV
jgi:hypothetical protein